MSDETAPHKIDNKLDIRYVELSSIRENPVALRSLQRETPEYQSLVRDVKKRGVMQPIEVREKDDGEEKYFEITDGLHRFSAASDAGLSHVNVSVVNRSEGEALEAQVVANLCRIDTKPIDVANQLRRMLSANPTLTLEELGEKISQPASYVEARLGLLKLDKEVQKLVNSGSINVSNAISLSGLRPIDQLEMLDLAQTMQTGEFSNAVKARKKQIREAESTGKAAEPLRFTPRAAVRKLSLLEAEIATPSVVLSVLELSGATTPEQAFLAALKWAVQLDDASVVAQEQSWNDRLAAREKAKTERAAVQAQARAEKAAAAAEEAKSKSGLSDAELAELAARQNAEQAVPA